MGFQALTLDRLSAAYTDTVCAERYALQRTLDHADFLHVAGNLRQIDIDQEVGERLILEVAYAAGDIGIAFVIGTRQRLAYFVPQLTPSLPQLVLEMRVLAAPGLPIGSSGIVRLGCHALIQQPRCPLGGGAGWRVVCYGPGMARGYSGSGGRFGGKSYGGYGTTGDYGYGAWGDYGASQFGGGAEEDTRGPRERRRLTPEEYWQRYFSQASYEGRTRGDDTGDRFVPPDAPTGGERPAHRMAGPSRHPLAPRGIRRSDAELYEDICEALLQRDDVDSSDVTVAVREGEVTLDGSVPERGMRYLIEDPAAGHPAVTDVDNRIKVRKT